MKTHAADFLMRLEGEFERQGLCPADMFRTIGIAHSTMSRWKAGSMPRKATICQIAAALDVSAEWLETGKEPASLRQTPRDIDERGIRMDALGDERADGHQEGGRP